MGDKHGIAVSLEHQLLSILEYNWTNGRITELNRAYEKGIMAGAFDQQNNIENIRNAVKMAVNKVNLKKSDKQELLDLLDDVETIDFSTAAELWMVIVVLLRILKQKATGQ